MSKKPISTPPTDISQRRTDANEVVFKLDTNSNERIRTLLSAYGLRISLIRLKVMNSLLGTTVDGHSRTAYEVYGYLHKSSNELTFVSVRNALKRLDDEGIVITTTDKGYLLSDFALAYMLQTGDD